MQYTEEHDENQNIMIPSEANIDNFKCFERKGMHIIHVNARSMVSKNGRTKDISK